MVQDAFPNDFKVGNATPAIFIVFLLFIIPSRLPWKDTSAEPIPSCLTWEVVHKKVPWGLILLVGGGFAMAEGASASGLSTWLQAQLQAIGLGIHPLYLMLPGTVCCSYAFMLPVSNPPNAIAFNAFYNEDHRYDESWLLFEFNLYFYNDLIN
ncbi:hypothetical protein Anas_02008 [Armadillidium nasatum]|uniref:Uncharacterized protein n=1 Tax=Armadillidium nasatum TaxID=96803 RepID=A0A5N5T059_9CRUS|nr:hypothetical protein Anas_02008 [Armadillidium nasatum]